jgi:ribosomal-protein-alanine N-acetyltransferase
MIKMITNRLIIRDQVQDDIDAMHLLLSDEKAMYYLPDIKTTSIEESGKI